MVHRVLQVARAEVEDPPRAAEVAAAPAKDLAALERAYEHELVRRRDVEELAVHLLVGDDDGLGHPGGDRMRGADRPDELALAAQVGPPDERAGRAHQALEDLRVVAGVEDHDAHAVQHPAEYALDHLIGHLVVRGVPPPGQDVRVGKQCTGQAVLRFVQGRHTHGHRAGELAPQALDDRRMHAVRVDLADRWLPPLVDVLVPHGHVQVTALRHHRCIQTGRASPGR